MRGAVDGLSSLTADLRRWFAVRQGSMADRRALFEAQNKANAGPARPIGGLQASSLNIKVPGAPAEPPPPAADAQPLSLKERMALLQGSGGRSESPPSRPPPPDVTKRTSAGANFAAAHQHPVATSPPPRNEVLLQPHPPRL